MDMTHRAYSVLDTKSIDSEKRIFTGLATSPVMDRVFDRIDPTKAKYAKEIPLLHAHKHDRPIGFVRLGKATKAGIPFEAEIPIIHEPPTLKERVDVAWGELVHGLVRAVSIGFRAITPPKFNDEGGFDFDEIEIMELSTVVVGAHQDALIDTIKSIDAAARRAAGIVDPEIQRTTEPAAMGKTARVVRLGAPARDRAKPFVIREIKRTV